MAGAPARWDLEAGRASMGSGLGGPCAAIAAHDQGAACVVLEKAGKLGGLSGFGGGEVFVPANDQMKALGLPDTLEEGRRYYEFIAAGYASAPHQQKLLDTLHEAIRYYGAKAGIRWKACQGLPDYY